MARDVLSLKPHEYQERTADELYEAGSGICCVAAMGAGKTGATLMALSDLFSDGLIDRAIIFAPKRVAQLTWPDEAVKWGFPGLVTLTGVPPAKRADAIRSGLWCLITSLPSGPRTMVSVRLRTRL